MFILYHFFLCFFPTVAAYHIGEPVHTTILSADANGEAVKSQRPLFGIDSAVTIPRSNEKISLGFEENYHQLSWVDTTNLSTLKVVFVYSRSGDGVISSVSAEPIMKEAHGEHSTHHMDVVYMWVEERPVGFHSGCTVMFLVTLVISLFLVLSLCGFVDDESDSNVISEEAQMSTMILHND